MSDIVERARARLLIRWCSELAEAIDEIERLRALSAPVAASYESSARERALEEACRAAMKAGVAFMDSSPVSDPEGTLTSTIQAIRSLSPTGEK